MITVYFQVSPFFYEPCDTLPLEGFFRTSEAGEPLDGWKDQPDQPPIVHIIDGYSML